MDDDEELDLFGEYNTQVTFKFRSIRIIDHIMVSNASTVKVEMFLSDEVTEEDVSSCLEKIHFWFDNIMSNSVLFCRDNAAALDLLFDDRGVSRMRNFPMEMPEEPSDDFLIIILHSKMNALAGDQITFGVIELQSDTRELLTYTFTGYGELCLPEMSEWVGDRAYHQVPWWARNDGSTLDIIPDDNDDLKDIKFVGVDLSFIDARFRKNTNPIIIRPDKFKPRVIDGGKNDDPKKD